MSHGSWKRRLKRNVLETIARLGYEVEKDTTIFPPYHIHKKVSLGNDPLADAWTIRGGDIRTVFDVGAHVGQTAIWLADAYPEATIYSFEPDSESYARLQSVAQACPRIRTVNAAAGDFNGHADFFVNHFKATNSLLKTRPGAERFLVHADQMALEARTTVPVLTLDAFCASESIDRLDLLKIDAQGYELRILDGAQDTLKRLMVPLIYLEVCFVQWYEDQPLFPDVYQYLYTRDYRLVWLYESGYQTHYYSVGANALFVHERAGRRRAIE